MAHLSSVGIGGFLSYASKKTIPLGKINTFIGTNSSGKSALLHALALLGSTLEDPSPDTSMLLAGNGINLGPFSDVIHGGKVDSPFKIDVSLAGLEQEGPSEAAPTGAQMTFRRDPQTDRPYLSAVSIYAGLQRLFTMQGRPGGGVQSILTTSAFKKPLTMDARLHHFLPMFHSSSSFSMKEWVRTRSINRFTMGVRQLLRSLVYIGPLRAPLDVFYYPAGSFPAKISSDAGNLVSFIQGQTRLKREAKRFSKVMTDWLGARMGLVSGTHLDRTGFGYRLRGTDPALRRVVALSNTGFGVSQVMPLLVLLATTPPPLLIVEQPEIHLHPDAQAQLGEIFVELAAAGTQVFVETHSEHLIYRLRSMVATKRLPRGLVADDIRLFHVEKKRAGSNVTPIAISGSGDLSNWPAGFFSASKQDIIDLLKARAHE